MSLLRVPSLCPVQLSAWMHLRTLSKSLLLVFVPPFHINLPKALEEQISFPYICFLER